MKIKNLIEILKDMDQDKEVVLVRNGQFKNVVGTAESHNSNFVTLVTEEYEFDGPGRF